MVAVRIMAVSGVVTAAILLPLAWFSSEVFFPSTAAGWGKVLGLALVSQVAGQSLIAYAMAHLPPTVDRKSTRLNSSHRT